MTLKLSQGSINATPLPSPANFRSDPESIHSQSVCILDYGDVLELHELRTFTRVDWRAGLAARSRSGTIGTTASGEDLEL